MAEQLGDALCKRLKMSPAVKRDQKKAHRKSIRKDGKREAHSEGEHLSVRPNRYTTGWAD